MFSTKNDKIQTMHLNRNAVYSALPQILEALRVCSTTGITLLGSVSVLIMITDSIDSSANCAKVPGKRCISGHSLCAANCFSSLKTIETHLRKAGFTVDSLRIKHKF